MIVGAVMSGIVAACAGSPTAPAADRAVAGAEVRVLDAAAAGAPTFTNTGGAFTVAALAGGRHLVEVSKAGYQVWETAIVIVDRDLDISVALIPTGM